MKRKSAQLVILSGFICLCVYAGLTTVLSQALANQQQDESLADVSVEKASHLYLTRCVPCHGREGRGRKEVAPKAPDFSSVEWQLSRSDEDLINAINNGIGVGKGTMPKWKNLLAEPEIKALVAFIRTLTATTEVSRAEAIEIYQQNCLECHGKTGRGRRKISPKVPNFTTEYWQRLKSDEELINSISNGRGKGQYAMPKWEGRLSQEQIKAVVTYIRTLNH